MWTVAQGCSSPVPPDITASDPLLTQNRIGVGKAGRKQRKIRRADGGKKHKSEPKRLRFVLETASEPGGRRFKSCLRNQKVLISCEIRTFSALLCPITYFPFFLTQTLTPTGSRQHTIVPRRTYHSSKSSNSVSVRTGFSRISRPFRRYSGRGIFSTM